MGEVLDAIQSLPPALAYLIIGALVFGEAAIFIGFVLPGETAVVFGGFLASQGDLQIGVLCLVVVVCAIVGDSVGYEVGKHYGPTVLRHRVFDRHRGGLHRGQDLLRRRGGPAVFAGRFTAFLRAVMPGLAGVSRMRYPTFLAWNALGGLTWGIGFALLGYVAGESYERVAREAGLAGAVLFGLFVVVAAIWWWRRRRATEEELEAEWGPPDPAGSDADTS